MSDHAVELICKTVTEILGCGAFMAFVAFFFLLCAGAFDKDK